VLLKYALEAHKKLTPEAWSKLPPDAKSGEDTKLAKCMRVLEVGTIKATHRMHALIAYIRRVDQFIHMHHRALFVPAM
jgi:hypothetical protein